MHRLAVQKHYKIKGFLEPAKSNGISKFHPENYSGLFLQSLGHFSDLLEGFLQLAKSNGISKFHPEKNSKHL